MKNYDDQRNNRKVMDENPDKDIFEDDFDEEFEDEVFDVDMFDEMGDVRDDRMTRVLDELSQLKRNISSPAPAVYPYAPAGDAAVYGEISRLRDELSKAQNSQSIQREMEKLKEELERSARSNEERLAQEVKKLKKQLAQEEGESESVTGGRLYKLCDGLSNYTKIFAGKVMAEFSDIKNLLIGLPTAKVGSAPSIDGIAPLRATQGSLADMVMRLSADVRISGASDSEEIALTLESIRRKLAEQDAIMASLETARMGASSGGSNENVLTAIKILDDKVVSRAETVEKQLSELASEEVRADRKSILGGISDIKDTLARVALSVAGGENSAFDKESLDKLALDMRGSDGSASINDDIKALREEVSKLAKPASPVNEGSTPDEVNLFLSEIVSLRDELQSYKDEVSLLVDRVQSVRGGAVASSSAPISDDGISAVLDELTAVRADISGYADDLEGIKLALEEGAQKLQTAAADDEVILEATPLRADADNAGYIALAAELKQLKDAVSANAATQKDEEISALRAEIAALRELIVSGSKQDSEPVSAKPASDSKLLKEIYDELRIIREEPDYGVMNEILALRDEFQAMKEQIGKNTDIYAKSGAKEVNQKLEELLSEIRVLRDQLFAISMASIQVGEDETYESYNNLIMDELASIGDGIAAIAESVSSLSPSGTSEVAAQTEELESSIADLKAELATLSGIPEESAPPQAKKSGKKARQTKAETSE